MYCELKEHPKTLEIRATMSTTEAASKVFEEIAQLFGSGPTDEQILNFRVEENETGCAGIKPVLDRE